MDIKDLEYFKAVCDRKSISKAAQSLYISQQGLSKIIQGMEKDLDTTLLIRKSNGITLTRTGAYLYANLPIILKDYAELRSNISYIERSQNHEIELVSAYGVLRLVTPECLEAFSAEYPYIHLVYHEYPDREAERKWEQGQGNIAFFVGNNQKTFPDAKLLETFRVGLIVNKENPLAEKKTVSVADLKGQKLYLENSEFNIHDLIVSACRKKGFEPEIGFETSGFSLCYKLVRENKGVSVSVDFISDDMSDGRTVMIPFKEKLTWTTNMLTRDDKMPNDDFTLFRNFVVDWMEKIRTGEIRR